MKLTKIALSMSLLASAGAMANTTIEVQYPYGGTLDGVMKQLKQDFEAKNPDITVKFRTAYKGYEEASQQVMREALTHRLPDVTFQGLNRIQALYERRIAVAVDDFISEEDKAKNGYGKGMMMPAKFGGHTYGVPFAVSMPIAYYNVDLVKKAQNGSDKLPHTWEETFTLANKVNAIDGKRGLGYVWDMTGNWLWLAPLMAQGGQAPLTSDGKVAFDNEKGANVMKLFARMHNEAKVPNYSEDDFIQAFAAGNLAMVITSSGSVNHLEKLAKGHFTVKTDTYPDFQKGTLPAGGNAAVLLSKDKTKQKAAWKFIHYVTGPVGNALVAQYTGYMSPNPVAAGTLGEFLKSHPNSATVIKQLPNMDTWHSFPGRNGLKITDMIKGHINSIFSGQRSNEPEKVNKDMAKEVSRLLPRKK